MIRALRRFVSKLKGRNKYLFFLGLTLICIMALCIGIYIQFFYKYAETDPLMIGINIGSQKTAEELAALEVEGVETNTTFTDKILKNSGVKIQIDEEEVNLEIMVNIDYGVSIPEIALKVQENVKNTIETMTGLKVSQVNIHVQGISFKKEKAEKEEAKQSKKS